MDHSYFRDKVSAYHDRELPAQEQEMLAQHIAACPECQKLLAEFERLDALVDEKSRLAETDYWEQQAQKIEAKLGFSQETVISPVPRAGWEKGLVWKLSAVAASIALLVFIGINRNEILEQTEHKEDLPKAEKIVGDSGVVDREADGFNELRSESTSVGSTQPMAGGSDDVSRQQQEKSTTDDHAHKDAASREGKNANRSTEPAPSTLQPQPMEKKSVPTIESSDTTDETAASRVVQRLATPPANTAAEVRENARASAGRVEEEVKSEMAAKVDLRIDSVEETAGAMSELVRWRTVRDSLYAILEPPKESAFNKYGVTGLQSDARKKAKTERPAGDLRAIRERYLEACFQIALSTNSPLEYTEVRTILEHEATAVDSSQAAAAKGYLARLKSERPTPPQK